MDNPTGARSHRGAAAASWWQGRRLCGPQGSEGDAEMWLYFLLTQPFLYKFPCSYLWCCELLTEARPQSVQAVSSWLEISPKLSPEVHPGPSPRSARKGGDGEGAVWGFALMHSPRDLAALRDYSSCLGNKQVFELLAAPMKCWLGRADAYGQYTAQKLFWMLLRSARGF